MNSLVGQAAVVTGGSSGVGHAIASSLMAQGVFVHLIGQTADKLSAVAASCPDKSRCHQIDLSEEPSIEKLIRDVQAAQTGIDILIHSAGAYTRGRVEDTSDDALEKQYQINFRAPFLLTRGLLPALRARRGTIVFINSSSGLAARGETVLYSSMKHALKAFADGLRHEVNCDGIRVMSMYLGQTATPLQERIYSAAGRKYNQQDLLQPKDIADVVTTALMLPNTAELTDLQIRPTIKSNPH